MRVMTSQPRDLVLHLTAAFSRGGSLSRRPPLAANAVAQSSTGNAVGRSDSDDRPRSRLLRGPGVPEPKSDHWLQRVSFSAQSNCAADSEGPDESQTASCQVLVADLNSGSVQPPPMRVRITWRLDSDLRNRQFEITPVRHSMRESPNSPGNRQARGIT